MVGVLIIQELGMVGFQTFANSSRIILYIFLNFGGDALTLLRCFIAGVMKYKRAPQLLQNIKILGVINNNNP